MRPISDTTDLREVHLAGDGTVTDALQAAVCVVE